MLRDLPRQRAAPTSLCGISMWPFRSKSRIGQETQGATLLTRWRASVMRQTAVRRDLGSDYPTPDGTGCATTACRDLAAAHLRALEYLRPPDARTLNVGYGHGYSVREVLAMSKRSAANPW